MGTCENCQWWGRVWNQKRLNDAGVCELGAHATVERPKAAASSVIRADGSNQPLYADGFGALGHDEGRLRIVTGRGFGCIHFIALSAGDAPALSLFVE